MGLIPFFYKYMDAPADYFKELDRMLFVGDYFRKKSQSIINHALGFLSIVQFHSMIFSASLVSSW